MLVSFQRGRYGLRSRLALLASALIVVAACGPAPSTPDPVTSPNQSTSQPPSPTGGQGAPEPSPSADPAAEGPPLSETLIATALAAGTITYEQSLLYRALALFDSPGPPEEFRSPVPDLGGATALFGEIDQREVELSPALLEKLAPYRARPADPDSIFNTPPGQAGTGMVLAAATPAPVWASQLVPGTNLRVWIKDGPFTEGQLGRFADVAATVWAQLPGVFRYGNPDQPGFPTLSVNPDGAIDVYFVETGTIDTRLASCLADPGDPDCVLTGANGYAARATLFVGTTSSGYVVVDAGLPGEQLLGTTAHELTHVGQFAYDRQESTWLMESTASWAAYRVMQKLGLLPVHEYGRISRTPFFKELDLPLDAPFLHSRLHVYASWLFFLFASMEAGDPIVTRVWEAAAAEGVQGAKAVDQAFPFDDHFADFSVRNWNQDPVTPRYKDVAPAPFPGELQPRIVGREATVMAGAGESQLREVGLSLASLYYVYKFEDAVRKVTFENAFAGVAHAHVWAIKKIGKAWAKPEDWTKDAKKEFCRDAADQNVTELVLIVSNSDMQHALPATTRDARVVAETTGCVGWVGEIRGQSSGGNLGGSAWQETSLAQVSFIPNPMYPTYDDVEFVLGSATVSWTSQWTTPPQDCTTTVFSGSYQAIPQDPAPGGERGDSQLDFRPPPDPVPTAGAGSSRYALLPYEAGGLSSIAYVPCVQHQGVSRIWWQAPTEAGVTASPDGRTIAGSWSSTGEGGDFKYSWTWTLHYVGPP